MNPLIILSSIASGFIVMYNWCSRHPYLVFFSPKLVVWGRYLLAMGLFFLLFTAIRSFIEYLTRNTRESRRKLFFGLDTLSCLCLAPILLHRFYIPGRHEGNRYYLIVITSWFLLKLISILVIFEWKTLRQIPRQTKKLFLKTRNFWSKFFQKKEHNLVYFTVLITYFFILQVLAIRPTTLTSSLIPLSYTFLFSSLTLFIHALIKSYLPKFYQTILIYSFFLLCTLLTLDYLSYQLLNIHMNESLGALFIGGIRQIPQALEGADVQPIYFLFSVLLTLFLPYLATKGISYLPSKSIRFSIISPFILSFFALGTCYLSDDYVAKKLPLSQTQNFLSALPIYPFFIKSEGEKINFSHPLKSPPSSEAVKAALDKSKPVTSITPHIFLIVIESFREDYINEKTAPFLNSLRETSPQFSLTASNANVTHCSLFTIYNALYPHHWMRVRDQNNMTGSFPLQLLKKAGYKINALHSSYFKYFNIGESLFGSSYSILDLLYEAKELDSNVAKRDQLVLTKSKELTASFTEETPQLTTLLLDSTHHHYYWDTDFEPPFKPFLKAFNYTNKGKVQLELTKNRYRNSIRYVDNLVKDFCDHLKSQNLYDSSLIIVTGDHGEEFMEHGHYFHGTSLCLPQSQVPIFYKFPENFEKKVGKSITSHVDIFPTIFDILGLQYPKELLDGESIFSDKDSYILSFRPHHKHSPYQFFFHNGKEKLEAKFTDPENIYDSRGIEIIAIKDLEEKNIPFKELNGSKNKALDLFENPLEDLFMK